MDLIKSIGAIVREAEFSDRQGNTQVSKYVTISMREDIDKTEAYLNSKHTSGDTDYLGREKPFFNIVISARNIWFRATDLDVKNISITATKEADNIKSFMATLLLQKWMRKVNFGRFLNDWGLSLSSHGSSVVEFVEKDRNLNCSVLDWNNTLCDQIDFDSGVVVKKLWLTPAQIKNNKSYNKELVKKLLDNVTSRTTAEGQKKDNKAEYIPVYEVHGELPLSLITDDEKDDDIYVQQMHVLTFLEKKDDGEFDDYDLYKGREAKKPHMLTHLIKKDGQTYAGGAVKNLFEAQWMVNHSQKQIKDQLDLASKVIFQTSDGNFIGQNALINIENGDILTYAPGKPLTQLNNKSDIAAMQANKNDWVQGGMQINGISESMMGVNAPSGTAWRQVQTLLQESQSLFELMTENKGLQLIDMLTEYVIPFIKKQMDNTDEIAEILDEYQLNWIDSKFVPNQAIRNINEVKKNIILSGNVYDTSLESADIQAEQQNIQSGLKQMGNQRFIKPSEIDGVTWKKSLKDLEWDLAIDVTGEAKDKQAVMTTLQTALQTIIGLQGRPMTPEEKFIFNRLLEMAGSSPLEFPSNSTQPAPVAPAMPVTQPAVA